MKTSIYFTTLALLALATSCGGFFRDDHDDDGPHVHGEFHHHDDEDDEDSDGRGRHPRNCFDAGSVSSPSPDASTPIADAGTSNPDASAPDVPQCGSSPDCAVGSQCMGGSCVPCTDGVCTCRRDEQCPAEQICDHNNGICVDPVVPCAQLSIEADCTARAECLAVYGGTNCTDENGGECTSGDPECTCETFSFVACVDQP